MSRVVFFGRIFVHEIEQQGQVMLGFQENQSLIHVHCT